ncbi:22358_t:CDS:2, partial [Entrophospora sp. SA101]
PRSTKIRAESENYENDMWNSQQVGAKAEYMTKLRLETSYTNSFPEQEKDFLRAMKKDEIVDGRDGNIYLYVGEKNDDSGREIKIGILKEEFNKLSGSKYDKSLLRRMNDQLNYLENELSNATSDKEVAKTKQIIAEITQEIQTEQAKDPD